jgi:hypothetical protein
MTRYGIDTAWLWEVLSVWRSTQAMLSLVHANMSIHPKASDTNAIRGLATDIRDDQLSPSSGTRATFDSSMQSASFAALSALSSLKVAFGTVPADVAPGDTVEKSHVADMFSWMRQVVCVHTSDTFTTAISSWTTTSGADGTGSVPSRTTANDVLLLWEWSYNDYSGGAWEHLSGGYWLRKVAAGFNVSVTLSGAQARWFSAATLFVEVYSNGYRAYAKFGSATISQSGNDVIVTATSEGETTVGEAEQALGITETSYSKIGSGWDQLSIIITGSVVCFLKFADDYRHPTAA